MHERTLEDLLKVFSELYWLKPFDIPWDAFAAYHVGRRIKHTDRILDLGCGDGILSALMFGARLPLEYDRFTTAESVHQTIEEDQGGDIYRNPDAVVQLRVPPDRKIDVGLELKPHHLKVARALGCYERLVLSSFEENPLEAGSFDAVFSVFAFYWASDLDRAAEHVHRVLRDSGRFFVIVPTEHLRRLHVVKALADATTSSRVREFFDALDGGRRALTTKYARSGQQWTDFFTAHRFETLEIIPVVNELIFTMQDIAQRPFLPALIEHTKSRIAPATRLALKTYLCEEFYPEFLKRYYEGVEGNPDVPHAYYLVALAKH